MNNTECTFMHDVVRAAKTGQWTDVLQTHTANCPMCLETIAVTTMMNTIASQGTPRPLPNHRTIWLKARYARKQERFTKFDVLALGGVTVSGLAGLGVLLLLLFPEFIRKVVAFAAITVPYVPNFFSGGAPVLLLAGVAALVWILTSDSKYAG